MPPKSIPPHYECLGVDPSISDADLSRHYKKLSLLLHPDRAAYRNDHANEVHVQARYQRITEAYAVLSDPEKRNAYDTKHGVNFQARLVRLQATIHQHNTTAAVRATASVAATAVSTSDANTNEKEVGNTTPAGYERGEEVKSDSDDDDDDYEPAGVAATLSNNVYHVGSNYRNQRRNVGDQSDGRHGVVGDHAPPDDDAEGEDDEAWVANVRRLFYLHPHVSSSASGVWSSHDVGNNNDSGMREEGLPLTQYRGVTLTRRRMDADGGITHSATEAQWGLVFEGNVLAGFQADSLEEEKGNPTTAVVDGLSEILFPAVVQQINDTMVRADADVAALLDRLAKRSSDASKSGAAPVAEERLQLVLAYCTEVYDLVGDTRLLSEDAVMRDVVPEWCVAAEIPALLPDVRVLAVNRVTVHSAEELRCVLRDVASSAQSADSEKNVLLDGASVAKRPRTTRTIVLECCHLPYA